jgi:phage-related minor tail protein
VVSRAALEIILQARDEASKTLNQVGDALGGTGALAAGAATATVAAAAGVAAVGAAAGAAALHMVQFSQETADAMRLLEARTGASASEMADFREQALDVYESGFGEGIADIADAMGLVNQALDETGDALEDSTRRALVLRDTFDLEVAEGAAIAAAAVQSGLVDSSEEAFDLITAGFQQGLNQAGDFGDTVREYSSDFERMGFTAEGFLGVLNAGLEEGAYNTDVIADGVREFGIRFGAAETAAVEALDSIGLNSEELYAQYEAGEITVADAMATITDALGDVDSETERARAGAALFGSKWEDLGPDVFMTAGQAQDAIEDVAGATDEAGEALDSGFGAAMERLKRTAISNLSPLADVVIDMMNRAEPYLDAASEWLGEKIPEGIAWLQERWETFWPRAQAINEEFWDKVRPLLIWGRYFLNQFADAVLPHLEDAWMSVKAGWDLIKLVIDRDLKPALQELFRALGIGGDDVAEISAKFGDFVGFIINTGVKALILGIAGGISLMSEKIRAAKNFIDRFREGMEGIREVIQWVKDKIDALGGALGGLEIPDWLTPGSPTPFEMGLRGIGDALRQLPDMNEPFGLNVTSSPPLAASGAAGGGGVVQIVNHFGRDSVRSDDDIEEIARRQEEMLEVRGVRTWEV